MTPIGLLSSYPDFFRPLWMPFWGDLLLLIFLADLTGVAAAKQLGIVYYLA